MRKFSHRPLADSVSPDCKSNLGHPRDLLRLSGLTKRSQPSTWNRKKSEYLKIQFVLLINIWFLFLTIATLYIGSVVDYVVFASSDYEWHETPLRLLLVCLMQYSPWVFLILSAAMISEGYFMSKKYSQPQYETNALKIVCDFVGRCCSCGDTVYSLGNNEFVPVSWATY